MSQVAAQFKKQDGTLTLSAEGARAVLWKPTSGAATQVTIPLQDIANLQQTPATAAKASVRITAQENYTFTFTSPSAREDQQAVTSTLRTWIEAAKAAQLPAKSTAGTPLPDNGPSQSAAMAVAQAVASPAAPTPKLDDETYDDAKLMRDVDLQRSLLSSDRALRERFDQAVRDRPDTITVAQIATQFWAARIHLLRSHAAEKAQGPGTYNALSVIKPEHVDGKMKLHVTTEQLRVLFDQHPILKRVYNENVPEMNEQDFWSRFFLSRLLKKLKGEKIIESDNVDPKLDKYLDMDDDGASQMTAPGVPLFIDLAGNEENNSQRQGNTPDWTMRPNSYDKVPILRTLNRMSEKMMAHVPPSDVGHAPAGMDEETYKELQLRDLQREDEDNRVVLKMRHQGQLFAPGRGSLTSSSASTFTKRSPAEVLSTVAHDLRNIMWDENSAPGLNFESVVGEDDSSSDEESVASKKARVGSRSSRVAATKQIVAGSKKASLQHDGYLSSNANASAELGANMGLSRNVFEALVMTHNTTVEFLHYFWAVYMSGDPDRAQEVGRLIETLDRSLDRLKAVADRAENEHAAKVEQTRREMEAYTKRTGKRRRFDINSIEGGAKSVNKIVSPLVRAIRSAKDQFEKTLHEQMG